MSNRILVLGATGHIGSFLVPYLKQKNADVSGAANSEEGKTKLQNMDVEGHLLNFSDPISLGKAMKRIDTLFMLTPISQEMPAWGQNILNAAKKNNVQFIVRMSIMDPYPNSPYLLFKLHGQVDQMVKESGINYSIIQSNVFMQNFAIYWGKTIAGKDTFYSMHGDVRVSYIDMRDVASIAATILTNPAAHPKREYTVTGPNSLTDHDVANILTETAGRGIRSLAVDETQFTSELQKTGLPDWDINIYISLEKHILEGHQSVISDANWSLTGKTSTSFKQYASDYASAWKKAPITVSSM